LMMMSNWEIPSDHDALSGTCTYLRETLSGITEVGEVKDKEAYEQSLIEYATQFDKWVENPSFIEVPFHFRLVAKGMNQFEIRKDGVSEYTTLRPIMKGVGQARQIETLKRLARHLPGVIGICTRALHDASQLRSNRDAELHAAFMRAEVPPLAGQQQAGPASNSRLEQKLVAATAQASNTKEERPASPVVTSKAGQPSYASATQGQGKQEEKRIQWAELVDAEETRLAEVAALTADRDSLLHALREKLNIGGQDTVLIPKNLEATMPSLFKALSAAAILCKCRLVLDDRVTIVLAEPDVWSIDPTKRQAGLTNITVKGKETVLNGTMSILTLQSFLGSLPTEENLKMTGPGRTAVLFIAQLVSAIWLEQEHKVSIKKSETLWKTVGDVSSYLAREVSAALGNIDAAKTIITSIEILYRKFLRAVWERSDTSSTPWDTLGNLVTREMRLLCASASTIYNRNLKTKTVIVKDIDPSTGRQKKDGNKLLTKKQTALLKPHFSPDALTPAEKIVVEKANAVLADIDSTVLNQWSPSVTRNPYQWASDIKSFSDKMYEVTAPFNRLVAERKKRIRAEVFAARNAAGTKAPSGASSQTKHSDVITQSEWINAENTVVGSFIANEESKTLAAFSWIPAKSLKELVGVNSQDIRICLVELLPHTLCCVSDKYSRYVLNKPFTALAPDYFVDSGDEAI
jgi:hypothetical protein